MIINEPSWVGWEVLSHPLHRQEEDWEPQGHPSVSITLPNDSSSSLKSMCTHIWAHKVTLLYYRVTVHRKNHRKHLLKTRYSFHLQKVEVSKFYLTPLMMGTFSPKHFTLRLDDPSNSAVASSLAKDLLKMSLLSTGFTRRQFRRRRKKSLRMCLLSCFLLPQKLKQYFTVKEKDKDKVLGWNLKFVVVHIIIVNPSQTLRFKKKKCF